MEVTGEERTKIRTHPPPLLTTAATPGERATLLRGEIRRTERIEARIRLTYACWGLGVILASLVLSLLSMGSSVWTLSDALACAGTGVGAILLVLGIVAETRCRRRSRKQIAAMLSCLSPAARAEILARLTDRHRGSPDATAARLIRQLEVSSWASTATARDRGGREVIR